MFQCYSIQFVVSWGAIRQLTYFLEQKINGFIIEQIFIVSGFIFVDHISIVTKQQWIA